MVRLLLYRYSYNTVLSCSVIILQTWLFLRQVSFVAATTFLAVVQWELESNED